MYIYRITNLVNNKVYIGQTTKNPERRWKEHKTSAKKDTRWLYQAIRKYGIQCFEFQVICEALEHKYLDELEILLIKEYNSFETGYNMTEGGYAFSLVGRPNTWWSKAQETRKLNGNTQATRTTNFEVLSPTGETLTGNNLTQFCREHNLQVANLWCTFYKTRKQHKGYILIRTFND